MRYLIEGPNQISQVRYQIRTDRIYGILLKTIKIQKNTKQIQFDPQAKYKNKYKNNIQNTKKTKSGSGGVPGSGVWGGGHGPLYRTGPECRNPAPEPGTPPEPDFDFLLEFLSDFQLI